MLTMFQEFLALDFYKNEGVGVIGGDTPPVRRFQATFVILDLE